MLRAIIIEDERLARESLLQTLKECSVPVDIIKTITNVKEGIEYLGTDPVADLIFSDVQLPDGLSFNIFEQVNTAIPVIFITAYDNYLVNAFECNGIDYLLKPTCAAELEKALIKYQNMEKHFSRPHSMLQALSRINGGKKRSRLVVRRGIENINLLLSDVVFFYTEHKLVYVYDRFGKKYLLDKTLGELETELDGENFFRANRQYIININYIKAFKTYEKVKLCVDMNLPENQHNIIISQETAPQFRKWMYGS